MKFIEIAAAAHDGVRESLLHCSVSNVKTIDNIIAHQFPNGNMVIECDNECVRNYKFTYEDYKFTIKIVFENTENRYYVKKIDFI